jgi:quercetin dioxygenase-like cupin family protein
MERYDNIFNLETAINEFLDPTDYVLKHNFLPGVYVRTLYLKKGDVLTGKIHKHECINIVAKGKIAVTDCNGDRKILVAGDIFNSPAGTKRAGFAFEDTVFINVFNCDETDVDKIENVLACDSVEDYSKYLEDASCH